MFAAQFNPTKKYILRMRCHGRGKKNWNEIHKKALNQMAWFNGILWTRRSWKAVYIVAKGVHTMERQVVFLSTRKELANRYSNIFGRIIIHLVIKVSHSFFNITENIITNCNVQYSTHTLAVMHCAPWSVCRKITMNRITLVDFLPL